MGGNHEHPNPVQFKYRLRKYLLGRDVTLMSEKTNSNRIEENTECVSMSRISEKPEPSTSLISIPSNSCTASSENGLSNDSTLLLNYV